LQLALWVAVTNAMLARAVLCVGRWFDFIGAGVALGLAQMAKGPHIAVLQTVLPVAAFLVWRRWQRREDRIGHDFVRRLPIVPVVLASLIAVAIGAWWYAYVWKTVPDVSKIWFHEVTRHDANTAKNQLKPDPWYGYVNLLRWFVPWTAWLVLGAWIGLCATWRGDAKNISRDAGQRSSHRVASTGSVFALAVLIVPLLVMSCFSEKKERYLTPFAVPAAALAAQAIVAQMSRPRDSVNARRPFLLNVGSLKIDLGTIAWIVTIVAAAWFAIGVPVQGMLGGNDFRTWDNRPWFSTEVGWGAAILGAVLLIGGVLWSLARRSLIPVLVVTMLATWLGHEMLLKGMASSEGNPDDRPQRRLAEQIWQMYPDATIYSTESPTAYGQLSLPSFVLSMYLNRVVYTRPAELPTTPGPVPLILLTDRPEGAETLPPPPGWARLKVIPMRRGTRQVDVLPAANEGEGTRDADGPRR
jgi:4-amino-4-deoxy-L-arabinose transferase-like glycosyltransferase